MALIYTFRGVYGKDLTDEIVEKIAYLAGAMFKKEGYSEVVVGGDHRVSTKRIRQKIVNGFLANDLRIIDIGLVPSPVLAYAAKKYKKPALMITASHNPPDWNGLEFHDASSKIYGPDWENDIKSRLSQQFNLAYDRSRLKTHIKQEKNIVKGYLDDIVSKIELGKKKLKVVIDSGNGMATTVVPKMLDMLAIDYIEINSGLDSSFPNRPSAPYPEHLKALKREVLKSKAQAGFAYDGDSDRLVILDNKGNYFSGDLATLLFCKELLSPNNIVLSIETSFAIEKELIRMGYNIENCRMGQTFLGEKIHEKSAVFAGEPNGHYTFPYFSSRGDGIVSTAYFCQVMSNINKPLSRLNKPLSSMRKEKFDWTKDISNNAQIEQFLISQYGRYSKLNSRLFIGQDDASRIIYRQSQFDPTLQISIETYDKKVTDILFDKAKKAIF